MVPTMDKKTYEKPMVLHTQPITTRAVNCNKADDSCTMNGSPLQS
jgi:hypothetical protein